MGLQDKREWLRYDWKRKTTIWEGDYPLVELHPVHKYKWPAISGHGQVFHSYNPKWFGTGALNTSCKFKQSKVRFTFSVLHQNKVCVFSRPNKCKLSQVHAQNSQRTVYPKALSNFSFNSVLTSCLTYAAFFQFSLLKPIFLHPRTTHTRPPPCP